MSLKNPHQCVIAHGCSLGAYHAANIALRHPHLFRKLAAFSGRYDLTMNVEGFPDLFEGYYNEDVYFHTPTRFSAESHVRPTTCASTEYGCGADHRRVRPVPREQRISKPDFARAKGVPHRLHVWEDRAHSARYWRRMARIYV